VVNISCSHIAYILEKASAHSVEEGIILVLGRETQELHRRCEGYCNSIILPIPERSNKEGLSSRNRSKGVVLRKEQGEIKKKSWTA